MWSSAWIWILCVGDFSLDVKMSVWNSSALTGEVLEGILLQADSALLSRLEKPCSAVSELPTDAHTHTTEMRHNNSESGAGAKGDRDQRTLQEIGP